MLAVLAPVVMADLEISAGEEPVWRAIHLIAFNEKEPERAVKPKGFLVFSGVVPGDDGEVPPEPQGATEAEEAKALSEEPKDDKPVLVVVARDGLVSIKSRRQPLIAILNEVASKTGIPIDLVGSVDMTPIDVEIRDMPLRDLGAALGRGGFRLVVRRNLATDEEWVQGVLVGEPKPLSPGR